MPFSDCIVSGLIARLNSSIGSLTPTPSKTAYKVLKRHNRRDTGNGYTPVQKSNFKLTFWAQWQSCNTVPKTVIGCSTFLTGPDIQTGCWITGQESVGSWRSCSTTGCSVHTWQSLIAGQMPGYFQSGVGDKNHSWYQMLINYTIKPVEDTLHIQTLCWLYKVRMQWQKYAWKQMILNVIAFLSLNTLLGLGLHVEQEHYSCSYT